MVKNKLSVAIFTILAISLGIWAFFIFRERNTQPVNNLTENSREERFQNDADQTEVESEETEEILSDSENPPSEEDADNEEFLDNEDTAIEKTNLFEISSENCDNDCKNFDEKEELEYCREFCGLDSDSNEEDDNCNKLSGLKKDYCLKDLAVREKDLEMCEEIEDSGILKACRNRITEDILDSQPQP